MFLSLLKAAFGAQNYKLALEHWKIHGINEGRRSSPLFDINFYLFHHPDLQTAFGHNYKRGIEHWYCYGQKEGRVTSPEFDVSFYLETKEDLTHAFGPKNYRLAFLHWFQHGRKELRALFPEFDSQFYYDNYPDLKEAFGPHNEDTFPEDLIGVLGLTDSILKGTIILAKYSLKVGGNFTRKILESAAKLGVKGADSIKDFALTTMELLGNQIGSYGKLDDLVESTTKLGKELKFTETTKRRMEDVKRYVPIEILAQAIKYGKKAPDPQGARDAMKYTINMYENGKKI